MSERLAEVGPNLALFRCNVDEVKEQDLNARIMPPEMMERLAATVRSEGRLEQLPLTVLRGDHFELMSGHHRVRAARAAGLTEIFVLADTRDLSKSKVRAKQLAHNAIAGQDDTQTLARLYAEMDSVEDVLESYLKPADFDDVKQLEKAGIVDISVSIPWKHLTLAFMPATMERLDAIDACVKKIPKTTDTIGVVSIEMLERFRTAAIALGRTEDVRSLGAIFTRMTEIVEAHLVEPEKSNPAAAKVSKPNGKIKMGSGVAGGQSQASAAVPA